MVDEITRSLEGNLQEAQRRDTEENETEMDNRPSFEIQKNVMNKTLGSLLSMNETNS